MECCSACDSSLHLAFLQLVKMPADEGRREELSKQIFDQIMSFDADSNGFIDASEFKAYLKVVGRWGTDSLYTEEQWEDSWPVVCELLEVNGGVDPDVGIPMDSFIKYSETYRKEKLKADLARLERVDAEKMSLLGTTASSFAKLAFSDLPPEILEHAEFLGFEEESWPILPKGADLSIPWDELEDDDRAAATALGYDNERVLWQQAWHPNDLLGVEAERHFNVGWKFISDDKYEEARAEFEIGLEKATRSEDEDLVKQLSDGLSQTNDHIKNKLAEAQATDAKPERTAAEMQPPGNAVEAVEEEQQEGQQQRQQKEEVRATASSFAKLAFSDLPPEILEHAEFLGFEEESWPILPKGADLSIPWDELEDDDRAAATALGYDNERVLWQQAWHPNDLLGVEAERHFNVGWKFISDDKYEEARAEFEIGLEKATRSEDEDLVKQLSDGLSQTNDRIKEHGKAQKVWRQTKGTIEMAAELAEAQQATDAELERATAELQPPGQALLAVEEGQQEGEPEPEPEQQQRQQEAATVEAHEGHGAAAAQQAADERELDAIIADAETEEERLEREDREEMKAWLAGEDQARELAASAVKAFSAVASKAESGDPVAKTRAKLLMKAERARLAMVRHRSTHAHTLCIRAYVHT
eukprot:COSAG05_NODE_1819_length_4019_cov_8.560714_3_plen_644_part_00